MVDQEIIDKMFFRLFWASRNKNVLIKQAHQDCDRIVSAIYLKRKINISLTDAAKFWLWRTDQQSEVFTEWLSLPQTNDAIEDMECIAEWFDKFVSQNVR